MPPCDPVFSDFGFAITTGIAGLSGFMLCVGAADWVRGLARRLHRGDKQVPHITIRFKDGSKKEFRHVGRPGGSYTKTVRYEGNFVIVTDEYGRENAYPSEGVQEVEVQPHRY